MSDFKLIDYRLYNPKTSIFKASKNDKAKFQQVFCSNSENCDAFENGACVMWSGLWGDRCPYGKKRIEEGYSQRAQKYSEWISQKKKIVDGINQLDPQPQKMCMIGEYIYFPYPHWNMDNIYLAEKEKGGLLRYGIKFISNERFTVDFIQSIILARPMALFGGEIASYQKEIVPKIVQHLKEIFPKIYKEWCSKYPETAKNFDVEDYVGRTAYIKTLTPGCTIKCKGYDMQWDGEYLITENFRSVFLPVEKPDYVYLKMKPGEHSTTKITSNDQVCETTQFKD